MSNPTCPKCNYEFNDDDTWYSSHRNQVNAVDGDISDLSRPRCGGKFHVICEHEIKWHPCDADGNQ